MCRQIQEPLTCKNASQNWMYLEIILRSCSSADLQSVGLGWEDPLEEGMATHSSVLAWRIPWTEEPGGLPSMRSHGVRHDWSDLAQHRMGPEILAVKGLQLLGLPVWKPHFEKQGLKKEHSSPGKEHAVLHQDGGDGRTGCGLERLLGVIQWVWCLMWVWSVR